MNLQPGDIIEAFIDELAMGELGQQIDDFSPTRTSDSSLLLNYARLDASRSR